MLKNFIAEIIHATKMLRARNAKIEQDLEVGRDLTVDRDLRVKRNANIDGILRVKEELIVDGKFQAKGDQSVDGNMDIKGNITVGGTGTIGKSLTVGESLTVTDSLTVKKLLSGSTNELYGKTDEIKDLDLKSGNEASAGELEKPARADHVHKIKPPQILKVKKNDGTTLFEYNGTVAKEVSLTPSVVGAAPTNHSSSYTTYGIGTGNYYGHVKLSDSTTSTSSVNDGIAATPKAVKTSYDDMKTYVDKQDSEFWNKAKTNFAKIEDSYDIEAFITPDSNAKFRRWYPSRRGYYRIYLVGGGGRAGSGRANYWKSSIAAPVANAKGAGRGRGMPCWGGGGGDVCVIDVAVNPPEPSAEEEVEGEYVDGGDGVDDAGAMPDGEFNNDTATSYAEVVFISNQYMTSTNKDGVEKWSGDDHMTIRSVAIKNISTVGVIQGNQDEIKCSYEGYDAVVRHGTDAFVGKDAPYEASYSDYTNDSGGTLIGDLTTGPGWYWQGIGRVNTSSNKDICILSGGTNRYPGEDGNISRSSTSSHNTSDMDTLKHRSNGFNGGRPGSANVHGTVGELGSNGGLKSKKTFLSANVPATCYVRGGTGACLTIKALNNYHGSLRDSDRSSNGFIYPVKTNNKYSGYGWHGGGNGGGGCFIGTNEKYTGSSSLEGGGNGNLKSTRPCAIIVYLGEAKPKTEG